MQILSIYILIGTLFSALADYAHSKTKANWLSIEAWEKSQLNNFDRFWLILLWPYTIIATLVKLFRINRK
jgi:hypothetical protein